MVMRPSRVLCPVDFSEASQAALQAASVIAGNAEALLYIVHVERSPVTFSPGISGNFPNPADPESHLLWTTLPTRADVSFEHALLLGDPDTEILRFAADHAVDLIVLGTHGRTGIARAVMGSVAEAILRRAPVPVMTVKPDTSTADAAGEKENCNE